MQWLQIKNCAAPNVMTTANSHISISRLSPQVISLNNLLDHVRFSVDGGCFLPPFRWYLTTQAVIHISIKSSYANINGNHWKSWRTLNNMTEYADHMISMLTT